MAKKRKKTARRSARGAKKRKAVKRKTRRRTTKPSGSMFEEARALRQRLAGTNTFED